MAQKSNKSVQNLLLEGVAIVLSILLAFAIDAGWDERQERAEEAEILDSLRSEFEANRDAAAIVISYHERKIRSVATLMSLKPDEILALPEAEVSEIISAFASPQTFDAVRGSVDALINSGKLGIIRDRRLREAVTTFANVDDDAVEDAYYLAQSSITVWNEIDRNGGPWRIRRTGLTAEDCASPSAPGNCFVVEALDYLPAATGQDLLNLRDSPVLMGYANRNKAIAASYSGEVRRAIILIDSILVLLAENQ